MITSYFVQVGHRIDRGATVSDEKAKDMAKGKAKEMTGKATGDRRKETEGKTDQTKAKVKGAMKDVRDRAQGMKDSLDGDES
jgi:uncharacterized protein YjbJ (UPF0337 family)